jgi:hypothetical protein
MILTASGPGILSGQTRSQEKERYGDGLESRHETIRWKRSGTLPTTPVAGQDRCWRGSRVPGISDFRFFADFGAGF